MSDVLTAAASALGAPEELVKRSAEARAKAVGTSAEEILAAWAGGVTVAAAPAAPAVAVEETAPADQPEPVGAPPAPPAPVAAEPPPAAPQPAAVAVVAPPVPEPAVEPAQLGDRIRFAGRIGAVAGAGIGVLVILAGSPWLVTRAAASGQPGAMSIFIDVVPGWLILGVALMSAVAGSFVGAGSARLAGWMRPGMELKGSGASRAWVSAITGAVLGGIGGAALTAVTGFADATAGTTGLYVPSSLFAVVIGGGILGWGTAAVVQFFGVPVATVEDVDEVEEVKDRLEVAVGVPVVALVALAAMVLPFAFVLIKFPQVAPLVAMLVAIGILTFAGLGAARPKSRVRLADVLVAAMGIGVIVLIIVAVVIARGGGGEHGAPAAGHASAIELLI